MPEPRQADADRLGEVARAVKDAVTFDGLYALLDREHPGTPVYLPDGWSFAWSEAAEDRIADALREALSKAGWVAPADHAKWQARYEAACNELDRLTRREQADREAAARSSYWIDERINKIPPGDPLPDPDDVDEPRPWWRSPAAVWSVAVCVFGFALILVACYLARVDP